MTCAANNICGRDPPPGSPGQASHPQSSPAIHSAFIEYAVFPGAYDPLLTCPIAKTELWGEEVKICLRLESPLPAGPPPLHACSTGPFH
ncbi:hypothetical protein NDU88_001541 [Pleurodeles waltl]|uniref:Uncharacterized protein n=1 Tax=Pleurodeles waltl TaxID=8319 RepID=A0AAV7U7G8_PLEWA|nr:hypothetical protein NDU88_001541 [Pleurodeles waltl]